MESEKGKNWWPKMVAKEGKVLPLLLFRLQEMEKEEEKKMNERDKRWGIFIRRENIREEKKRKRKERKEGKKERKAKERKGKKEEKGKVGRPWLGRRSPAAAGVGRSWVDKAPKEGV